MGGKGEVITEQRIENNLGSSRVGSGRVYKHVFNFKPVIGRNTGKKNKKNVEKRWFTGRRESRDDGESVSLCKLAARVDE